MKEVREGDTLTIKVRVSRVSDDGEQVTIAVGGYRNTFAAAILDAMVLKHENGSGWPS